MNNYFTLLNKVKRFAVLVLPLGLFTLLSACATNPVTGEQDLVLMSEGDEIALGNRTRQQVLQE